MCLYIKEKKPRIAKEDITVLKYVKACDDYIVSPYQFTKIPVNEILTASPNKEVINLYESDLLGNNIYSLSSGAIHAKLIKGGFFECECKKAIIPAGTEYWIGVHGDEIAARSMIITDIDWDKGNNKVSECIFKDILENAPEVNNIRIGDYLLENGTYTRPRKDLTKDEVVGIVAGFHKGKPLIVALTFFVGAFDKLCDYTFEFFSSFNNEAIKKFNGRHITEEYKLSNIRDKRFEAFEACINYRKDKGEEWYLGTAGEVSAMLDNYSYLNAANNLTGLGFLIGDESYNSCSKISCKYSLYCYLTSTRANCYVGYMKHSHRIVPFLSL